MAFEAENYQKGDSIDHTPTVDVAAGQLVALDGTSSQNDLVGVANADIKANALGAIAIEGVYKVAKDGLAIGAGGQVFFDATGNQASSGSSGNTRPRIGRAIKAAAAGDPHVLVKLLPL